MTTKVNLSVSDIPNFSTSSTTQGLVPGSNNVGSSYYLRADGTWALVPTSTNLTYTASTRVLASDTGTDATLPLFDTASTNAGLVPGSNGVTTGYLKSTGTWDTTIGTNATGSKTVSTAQPSGGSDGDVWYVIV